ncbi:MAG TPA: IS1595 family transposase [Desulfocapsa sulfexigens]|nr:IS1595 family transposase [Desulfocapsa sulfexigens]
MTGQKYGANALGMQRILNFGSYRTAWQWLHKIRRAMVRPGRDRLSGTVEIDETYVGGKKPGKRGRGAEGKELVGIAVEDKGSRGIGRIRLWHLEDASSASLLPFVQGVVEPGSAIHTDNWSGYTDLSDNNYIHNVMQSKDMTIVHLVASLLKRWILGTYQGAVRPSHLTYYLDEFTFRFNRRTSASRGKLFYRLMQHAVLVDPAPASSLKGPAFPFLEDTQILTHSITSDHNMWYVLELYAYPSLYFFHIVLHKMMAISTLEQYS